MCSKMSFRQVPWNPYQKQNQGRLWWAGPGQDYNLVQTRPQVCEHARLPRGLFLELSIECQGLSGSGCLRGLYFGPGELSCPFSGTVAPSQKPASALSPPSPPPSPVICVWQELSSVASTAALLVLGVFWICYLRRRHAGSGPGPTHEGVSERVGHGLTTCGTLQEGPWGHSGKSV